MSATAKSARRKRASSHSARPSAWTCYSYAWVTLAFFLISIVGHWVFAWFAYVDDHLVHQQPIEVSGYLVEVMRDTLENWQSEFLQLLWQVGGLSILLYAGSPQSKEGSERIEAKIDMLLRRLDAKQADSLIAELDRKFPGRD